MYLRQRVYQDAEMSATCGLSRLHSHFKRRTGSCSYGYTDSESLSSSSE